MTTSVDAVVRCISLWQPWASLMACGAKMVETRGWGTHVRGTVYIHAAKTLRGIAPYIGRLPVEGDEQGPMESALGLKSFEWKRKLPFGQIIAVGELVDCQSAWRALAVFPLQKPFGDYTEGRYGHIYHGLRAIEPIPYRGAQGFFRARIAANDHNHDSAARR